MPSRTEAVWRADATECTSQLCVRPAPDPTLSRVVDTAATCTRPCASDADCADGERRNPTNLIDKRCTSGFVCGVGFTVGPLACQKLCLCRDFVPSGSSAPAWCAGR
jgi:hypothetical protein